jgi:hypothetical protein
MPDVRAEIDELRLSLQTARDERVLLVTIEERVAALREVYRRDQSQFTDDEVQFLRGLMPVTRALRAFLRESRRNRRRGGAEARQLALL